MFTRQGVQEVSFLPMVINDQYRPQILEKSDPRFDEMVNYMEWASEGFAHRFMVRGDEVVIADSV